MAKLTSRQKIKRAKIERDVYARWVKKALWYGMSHKNTYKQQLWINKQIGKEISEKLKEANLK